MNKMIYVDNAATTRLAPEAFEAMRPFLTDDFANTSQPYSFARAAKAAIKSTRETVARCIGAEPDEIFFTSGGTEGDNWAIKGSAFAVGTSRTTITSTFEHHAVLGSCEAIAEQGYPVRYITPDKDGFVQPDSLERAMTQDVGLVSIMLANNELGTIQDVKALCEIAHSRGATFHTDAVQAVGHLPIDVRSLGVDMLSSSAHKFNGPKGVGFMYVKRGTHLAPYANGGAQEHGMRAGTENVAGIVGLAAALDLSCREMGETSERLRSCERIILPKLSAQKINFIRNGGDDAARILPGMMSLSLAGADGEALLHRLDLMGICVSTGSACDGANTDISHVLRAIALDETYARGTIRISLGRYNTEREAEHIGHALVKIFDPNSNSGLPPRAILADEPRRSRSVIDRSPAFIAAL